ncbi:MAG: ABC transporter substrate-binding protein [Anaerolineae bacterium]|nr:ABC transporter substrate-binding protein [Anaerolineae bacterium]
MKLVLRLTTLALVSVFGFSLFALNHAPAASQDGGGTYRAGFRDGCVQSSLITTCGHRLDATVMQPLAAIRWTADGLQPLLAESWQVEEDGRVFIFNLREGVTWHDGEPFTADDVIFSFNAYANPAVGSRWADKLSQVAGYAEFQAGEADSLVGVTKVDDLTVRVELASPAPLWLELSQIYIVIFPEHILGEVPPEELVGHSFWTNRIGTGPFRWANYEPDQFIELERNADYFLGAPQLERIIYQIYSDANTHVAALENGEIDSIAYETLLLPVTEVGRLLDREGIFVKPTQDAGLPSFLRLNSELDIFADERVRQAMMYAIDRQAIVDSLWEGYARVANTFFPQEWTWAEDMNTYAYDPDRARELLEEAGWDSSREIDFVYHYGDSLSADLIVVMQQYLADVGIIVNPRRLDPAVINEMYLDGSFELGYFALGIGLDPSAGETMIGCGTLLAFSYCNERVDELFDLGLSTADRDERAVYYQEISQILNEEVPAVWLWYQVRPMAFSTRVDGLVEHWQEQPVILFNLPVYNEIETWSVSE